MTSSTAPAPLPEPGRQPLRPDAGQHVECAERFVEQQIRLTHQRAGR
ncbi:hypothetical protein [Streptomyces sp. NPDC001880]